MASVPRPRYCFFCRLALQLYLFVSFCWVEAESRGYRSNLDFGHIPNLDDDSYKTDPIAVEVPLQRPQNVEPCVVDLVTNAHFGLSRKAHVQKVSVPGCAHDVHTVSMVVLELNATVKGRQFDRIGGFWIDNLKLLHLSTPEPLNPGKIRWFVERDITELARSIVGRRAPFQAILDIPNVVTGPYTGVINATVRALIYHGGIRRQPLPMAIALRAPFKDPTKPWEGGTLIGTERLQVKFPSQALRSCVQNGCQLKILLFASGHGGSEEFYYLEAPGGSPFREFIVHFDGSPVTAIVPFPVVYTGGINPLLWRPLTGILALDVAPYELDVSFLLERVWGKSEDHTLEIEVLKNSEKGVWYVDPVLIVYHRPPGSYKSLGLHVGPPRSWNSPYITTEMTTLSGSTSRTQSHDMSNGDDHVHIEMSNLVEDDVVYGHLHTTLQTVDAIEHQIYKFAVMEKDGDGWIAANVNETRFISRESRKGTGYIALESTYSGRAYYNMSKGGHRASSATQSITVWDKQLDDNVQPCFHRTESQVNGSRILERQGQGRGGNVTEQGNSSLMTCDSGELQVVPCGASFCTKLVEEKRESHIRLEIT